MGETPRRVLDALPQLPDSLDYRLLLVPLRAQGIALRLQVGNLGFYLFAPLAGGGVLLALERLHLDFELQLAPLDAVECGGQAVDIRADCSGRFVDQVDGLVGQEPVADVAVRQVSCRD